MKTSYELAMERLAKTAPTIKLTTDQKKRLAELDSQYKAKIADREIFLGDQLKKARQAGEAEVVEQLEKQLASNRQSLQAELEAKKENIRSER